ncbi:hypothetical protein RO3G_07658 [Rhizopus delemar RA 99-880]|uniref:Uncharacterized protein n=1 Tax=Rhizopus delemar (strain RA 99-880 / ATCC MYA-4621 / FGSC 9543 / NRRL 43880) TaxID=246409 RepID=I1C3C3_RHIO9|nr:hypothetical protein RO3G_07658 [Rhizopus delemar RA 99-880]|eukprot:EIE82953.1 hypothetical protein RO3G_07658 [Rhizopus delemar RA 99-880]
MTWQVAAVRRGTARMMDSSQFLVSVDKRDRGTWYTGPGLKNAACYGRNGLEPFSASVTDMIGAMKSEIENHSQNYRQVCRL